MAVPGSTQWKQEQNAKKAKETGGSTGGVIGTFTKALKDTVGKVKDAYTSTGGTGGVTNSAKDTGGNTSTPSTPSGGFTKYTGGNTALNNDLKPYQDAYSTARASGDWQGMNAANEKANQLRNQYGYAAESAYDDINLIRSQYGGGTDFSQSGVTNTQQNTQLAPGVTDYSQYIEEMNQAAKESALAELRSAYQQNLAGIDRTQQSISPTYTAARNQAAGSAEQAKRQFSEYAAANGLNSGAGGQAQLAMNNALQTNLSNLNTQEASSLADLELQRSQAEIDYNNAIAKAQADGNYTLAQQLYAEKVRTDEALRAQMQWQAEQDYNNSQFQWQQEQADLASQKEDTSNLYQMVMKYAQSTGDYSLLSQFGFTADQIARMQAQWQTDNAANPISSRSASASGGSSKSAGAVSVSGYNPQNVAYDFAPATATTAAPGTTPMVQNLTASIPGTMSTSAKSLLSQLRSIPGLTEDNKAAMVQDAYQHGRISEGDVNQILAAIGY